MHDAQFAARGRLADPHLWIRAERLAPAGVATTPTLFAAGERRTSPLDLAALERLIQQPS